MGLKSLIQRLLDSRTTPSEAAHSAMPSSSYVTVTATAVQAWGEMAKGVATFDGFVRVSARATSSNANVRVTNDTAAMFSQIEATASGQTQGVFVPVAKGDSWSVFGTNRDNPVVRVVKAIGGGYNCFVWRALSCLRALSNFLLKVSSRAKRSGCLNGLLNCLTQRQSLIYQRQTLGQSSQCRLTVGQLLRVQTILQRRLTATFVKGNTKCSVFASVVSPTALQQFLFRAKKVKPSALPFTQTVRTSPLEHLKHFRLANLETGGALC